jgi:hypothetical protein
VSASKLRNDPLLPPEEAFAYRCLARFGITPESSAREVLDASFEMSPEELRDERINRAWESLRSSRTRLELDFFLLDLAATAPPPTASSGEPLPALPWKLVLDLSQAQPLPPPAAAAGEKAFTPPLELPAGSPAFRGAGTPPVPQENER